MLVGVALLILALALTIVALGHYGRGREAHGVQSPAPPWRLLIATWRDSFILTLLYAAIALMRDGVEVQKSAFAVSEIQRLLIPVVVLYGSVFLRLLIIYIAVVRIIELGRWLRSSEAGT